MPRQIPGNLRLKKISYFYALINLATMSGRIIRPSVHRREAFPFPT
jgi:hypothetical protein